MAALSLTDVTSSRLYAVFSMLSCTNAEIVLFIATK